MPISKQNAVLLDMIWLREQNPEIHWKALTLKPREHGHTKLILAKSVANELRTGDVECVFVIDPHESDKAERFKLQGWETLKDNLAYDVSRKYKDTVFSHFRDATRTSSRLAEAKINIHYVVFVDFRITKYDTSIRKGIEHEIKLKLGGNPCAVPQWRQSPEQRKSIQDWTKEMVKAGNIPPNYSSFWAPTFCVKKPVGWRIVHDY
ncbi:hypothetical protein CCR75_000517 [Bremia lactucae]|uniref:Uncharacterized protein n=1 Tax=Bremia lactucae TaxID=4779 RepID=A0A976NYN2_BRELC|nr:hypothetical protein CCR75_000517 [Bremia lactucae]